MNAIVDGLAAAGHPRNSIVVWDRSVGGIKDAGYRPAVDGYQVKATAPHEGYDAKAMLSAPLVGKLVWGDFEYVGDTGKMPLFADTDATSNVSHFSKIISSDVDKIINVPVMSVSETNGIAGCIYNMTDIVAIELRFRQQVAPEALKNIPKRAKRVSLGSGIRVPESSQDNSNWQEGPQESLHEMRSH